MVPGLGLGILSTAGNSGRIAQNLKAAVTTMQILSPPQKVIIIRCIFSLSEIRRHFAPVDPAFPRNIISRNERRAALYPNWQLASHPKRPAKDVSAVKSTPFADLLCDFFRMVAKLSHIISMVPCQNKVMTRSQDLKLYTNIAATLQVDAMKLRIN